LVKNAAHAGMMEATQEGEAMKQAATVVIVPTYKEEDNIDELVGEIFRAVPQIHVLFVDDNSPDHTQAKIKRHMDAKPDQVHLLARAGKLGLASAYLAGFEWALGRGYDNMIEMDADLSHHPSYLPTVLRELEQWDVAIGSRYIPQGGTKNWSLPRRIISRFGSFYARTILGLRLRDLTGGFNGWRRPVLEAIRHEVKSEGYSFQIELKYLAHLLGFKIKEFPIIFTDRRVGHSKMSSGIVVEAMLMVWSLRRKYRGKAIERR
jgi:dolichol-phosphate mannosyltransferase